MSNKILDGKVSFVNHDKHYIMIEFLVNGKKKNINAPIDDEAQQKWIETGLVKKKHHFRIGDFIKFTSRLADRGDKMIAENIQFRYNEALDVLINKANTINKFTGYIKEVDGKYFIKEIDTYLFFQIPTSPWQIKLSDAELNEAVYFSLENMKNKEKVTAKLFNNKYIPEFYTAVKLSKANTPVEATIYDIKPHGIYLNVIGNKINAKLPFEPNKNIGDKLVVTIEHIGDTRIIVKPII